MYAHMQSVRGLYQMGFMAKWVRASRNDGAISIRYRESAFFRCGHHRRADVLAETLAVCLGLPIVWITNYCCLLVLWKKKKRSANTLYSSYL